MPVRPATAQARLQAAKDDLYRNHFIERVVGPADFKPYNDQFAAELSDTEDHLAVLNSPTGDHHEWVAFLRVIRADPDFMVRTTSRDAWREIVQHRVRRIDIDYRPQKARCRPPVLKIRRVKWHPDTLAAFPLYR
ncbi:MAG TPA: hypothetical protein VGW38_19395 [Chloroflexota bacterium]|nr:hypothetical protein [Chloroflexota bacterium]